MIAADMWPRASRMSCILFFVRFLLHNFVAYNNVTNNFNTCIIHVLTYFMQPNIVKPPHENMKVIPTKKREIYKVYIV